MPHKFLPPRTIETTREPSSIKFLYHLTYVCHSLYTNTMKQQQKLMENPIKYARLQSGLSQLEFATQARVTRGTLLRYEQGCFTRPTSKLLTPVAEVLELSFPEIEEWYKDFQISVRVSNNERLQRFPSELARVKAIVQDVHPLVTWRGLFSQVGFCVAFCLHPAQINKYENYRTTTIPSCLTECMEQLGRSKELRELKWL